MPGRRRDAPWPPLPTQVSDSAGPGAGAGAQGSYFYPPEVLFGSQSFLAWMIKGSVFHLSSAAPTAPTEEDLSSTPRRHCGVLETW